MAIMRNDEIRKLGDGELQKKMTEINRELMKVRTKISSKMTPDNPGHVREMKKTIARLKTEMRQRQRR
jgi:large subunit ribosomal protein L29